MNANSTIIDVTPVEHSSARNASAPHGGSGLGSNAYESAQSAQYTRPTWGATSARSGGQSSYDSPFSQYGGASQRGQSFYAGGFTPLSGGSVTAKVSEQVMSGLAQMAIGTGLVLLGIPMLILPGPGLLSIAGGMLLASRGARKVLG